MSLETAIDQPASRLPVFDENTCAEDMDKMVANATRAANFLRRSATRGGS